MEETKQRILDEIVQEDALRLLLDSMDQEFRDSGTEPPNWCRLFAGACGTWTEEVSRPIRLRDLEDMADHAGTRQVVFCKRFDLDTVNLVSRRLDVLKSIRLVLKRDYLGAFQAERDDLSRGRLYIPGVERHGQFPRVLFRVKSLPREQVILKTGYATKRFIGYPRGDVSNKTFMGQMYCNLGSDHEKWAAWECCYSFMAACLRGGWGASPNIAAPRSSSLCIPNPYKGEKARTWMAGIAVSSQEDCQELMELVLNPQLQRDYFDAEFGMATGVVTSYHQRYLARVQARQNNEDDGGDGVGGNENRGEAMDADGDEQEARDFEDLVEEVGQVIEEGRRGPGELHFDFHVCLEHFAGMMQNLYFVTTIQLGRQGCGTITRQVFPHIPFLPQAPRNQYDLIGAKIRDIVEQYVCLDMAGACPTLLAPHVGMEVTIQEIELVLGQPKRPFKVASPLFENEQGIRLHLDRRKFREKPQEWTRRLGRLDPLGGLNSELKFYDAWGNMSKTDGPMSFKGKLPDVALVADGGDFDAMLDLLLPREGRFGVQAPILCIYECTYRATSPYTIFKKEKQLLEPYMTLASRASTRSEQRKSLEYVSSTMVRECLPELYLAAIIFLESNRYLLSYIFIVHPRRRRLQGICRACQVMPQSGLRLCSHMTAVKLTKGVISPWTAYVA